MICGRTERILVYCILVKPTVAWWVHLVELGQHGPDGFVGEVVHQLLQAKKKKTAAGNSIQYSYTRRNQTSIFHWEQETLSW
jgi:hypothetical protein